MRSLVVALVMSAVGVVSALDDTRCRCRGRDGQMSHEGDIACTETANGPRLARCEMALNITTWTVVRDDCPTSMATPLRSVASLRLTLSFGETPGEDHIDLP